MPELPDLQAFSGNLIKLFAKKTLEKINVPNAKKLNVTIKELQEALEGQPLTAAKRVGKELHFEFKNEHILGLHLMLHGQLHLFDGDNTHKYTIVEMIFEGGKGLALTDFQAAATPTLDPKPNDVPDALDIDLAYLKEKLGKTRSAVKTVLMDQKKYAVLVMPMPMRYCGTQSYRRCRRLIRSLKVRSKYCLNPLRTY